ncbi:MAG TPA: tyrosine-type recombinase/integrase [Nitrolancea sp.]|jgi:integrase/recombinase XerD|nr:tyrosine-type recombinase/integrase [Nitrolancea sp.]
MEELIGRFLDGLEGDRGFSPNTVSAYRNDLGQFCDYLETECALESWPELSSSHLTGFVLFLRERDYANSTVARKVAAVRSFCHYLINEGLLRHDPSDSLPSPRVDKFVPKAISRDDIEALLAHAAEVRTPEGMRDFAMLQTLYSTGMRVSELTSLDMTDIDLAEGELSCGRKPDRSRTVPLSESATAALSTYFDTGRPLLRQDSGEDAAFLNHRGSRLTRQGFWLILKSHAEAASIPDITPHTIRHTFAAHALNDGQELRDIQRILGHMSISTTQVYQRVTTEGVLVATGAACYDSSGEE